MPVTGKTYYDAGALLTDENARAQDSVMSGADDAEWAGAIEMLTTLKAENKLDQFVADHDKISLYGCGTIMAGVKK